MLNEFRNFIAKGNVMDMAVGIIVGAAFTGIVNSIVKDLINPIIAVFSASSMDFTNWFYALNGEVYASLAEAREAGAPVFAIGSFLMAIINFLIVAMVAFMLVKSVNRAKASFVPEKEKSPDKPAGPTELQVLLEIRDSLQQK